MLNLCITLDYELFLGENYFTNDDILFSPTNLLLQLFTKHKISTTFFVDVCSLFQHKKYNIFEYTDKFNKQLLKMNRYNQDIQLHIHPNWLKSKYKNGKWQIDTKNYKIHSFGFNNNYENCVQNIIRKGKLYLEDLIMKQDASYKCIAFRAGGFCIQPIDKLFRVLIDNDILIDSSVARNLKNNSKVQNFDFTNIPIDANWWVMPEFGLHRNYNKKYEKCIYEVPIASIKNNIIKKLIYPKEKYEFPQSEKKGTYIKFPENIVKDKDKNILLRILNYNKSYSLLSLDSMKYDKLFIYLLNLYNNYNCLNNEIDLSIICHPKLSSSAFLKNMNNFILLIKKHPNKFRFITMREIYKERINHDGNSNS